MSRAILIGNGPSAIESKKGDLIDSDFFDIVIRFNRGHKLDDGKDAIGKFSEFVGTKCNYWIASDLRIKLAIERSKVYEGIFIVTPKFKFNPIVAQEVSSKYSNIIFIPPSYEDDINSIANFNPQWPSTGIVGIHFAINHFNEVYIHGFDTYDRKYDTLHFFEDKVNKYKDGGKVDHSPNKEKEYLDYMLDQGKIKIL